MSTTLFRHANHNTYYPPLSSAMYKTTVQNAGGHCMLLFTKIPQQYCRSAAGSTVCLSIALKSKDQYITSHSHSHILPWFECTFTLQRYMLIREAVNSTGTSVTSARQHGTNHIPKFGYLYNRIKFM